MSYHKVVTVFIVRIEAVINIPGVAWVVVQTPSKLVHSLTESSFVKISSKHCISKSIKNRDLIFKQCSTHSMCYVSYVACHVSHVTSKLKKIYIWNGIIFLFSNIHPPYNCSDLFWRFVFSPVRGTAQVLSNTFCNIACALAVINFIKQTQIFCRCIGNFLNTVCR